MSTLLEIEQGWSAVWHEVGLAGGELTAETAASLDALNLEEKSKADGYVYQIKGLEGDAAKYKALADELLAKAKTAQGRADWLKQRVRDYMAFREITELRGETWRFALQKAGKPPVEILVTAEELPREWTTITVKPNLETIRKVLTSGEAYPPVARLGEASLSLRIY
jgi:hypothetical protein